MAPSSSPSGLPTGELKVRKRRENRSSAAETGGVQYQTFAEDEQKAVESPLQGPRDQPSSPARTQSSLHRRKSSKNKVFSKVLGTIQNGRSHPGHHGPRNGQSDGGLFRRLSLKRAAQLPARSKSNELPMPASSTPLLTPQVTHASLGPNQALSGAKETSPQLTLPLPAPEKGPAQDGNPKLAPPHNLGVDLNLMPETDTLSLYKERSLWIAVEVAGVLRGAEGHDPPASRAAIDAVLIIDNSRYASPACLEAACEIALRISQLMSDPEDRIAIICTSCRHRSRILNASGCLLHPLKPPNLKVIGQEIRAIRSLSTQPPAAGGKLGDTLHEAIKILSDPTNGPDVLRLNQSHVFIISPQSPGNRIPSDSFAPITVHAICPAVIPYQSKTMQADAWKPSAEPLSIVGQYDCTRKYLHENSAWLPDILAHCRRGHAYGCIKDLQLAIRPHSKCVIESVLGPTTINILEVGQTMTILLNVRIPASLSASREPPPTSSITNFDDAVSELEILLGEAVTELFTIRARYNQSVSPADAAVRTETMCSIRRSNPFSQWSIDPRGDILSAPNNEIELCKRLAYFIATQNPVQEALKTLDAFSNSPGLPHTCFPYINSIRQELRYQIYTLQPRTSIPLTTAVPVLAPSMPSIGIVPSGPTVTRKEPMKNITGGPRHYPSHPHFSFEPHDSLRFTAVTPTPPPAHRSVSTSQLTTPGNSDIHEHSPDNTSPAVKASPPKSRPLSGESEASATSVDEARAIWREMRRDSQPRRGVESVCQGKDGLTVGVWLPEERVVEQQLKEQEIRRKAVANKRSIGADTLRSLAMGGCEQLGSGRSGYAPWMV